MELRERKHMRARGVSVLLNKQWWRVGKIFVHLPEKIILLFTTTVPNFGKILVALF